MPRLKKLLGKSFIGLVILFQISLYPLSAHVIAQETESTGQATSSETTEEPSTQTEGTTTAESTTAPTEPAGPASPTGPTEPTGPQGPTGPTQPTGDASQTYHYNEATGLWENDHYTWDPNTGQTSPKQQQSYSYNPETGLWDTTEWRYDPASGTYVENTYAITNAQLAALGLGGQGGSLAAAGALGPNSNNSLSNNTNNNTIYNGFYDARITNILQSTAQSGNANVLQNNTAGSALTGDAQVLATILNLLRSSWDPANGDILTFSADVNGDVFGDLLLDPNLITGPGSNLSVDSNTNNNLQVRVAENSRIDNDITLDAGSGNALVDSNTQAGDAESGSASSLANIINMINSIIAARQSFVGQININGNLNGDILLPQDLINALLAATTGPNSSTTLSANDNTNLNLDVNDNKTITNNITTDVSTGDANVTDNTIAGNATTGDAETNIVLLNLTGKQIVASNALLVFVNVFGTWVGLIMDAPVGTNAAVLGGNTTINQNSNTNIDADIDSNSEINNDVNVNAHSGDATVSRNTIAGGATTGDANAGANILNMIDSEFDVSGWFGVLFINVLGNWTGSFGINTAAGNQPVVTGGLGGGSNTAAQTTAPPVFSFVPTNNNQSVFAATSSQNNSTPNNGQTASATATSNSSSAAVDNSPLSQTNGRQLLVFALVIGAAGVLLLGSEQAWAFIVRRR